MTTTAPPGRELDRYRRAAATLHDVAKPMRVLSRLAWPAHVRDEFLASGGTRMPDPEYSPLDPTATLEGVAEARRLIDPGRPIDDWLESQATAVEAQGSPTAMRASCSTTRRSSTWGRC